MISNEKQMVVNFKKEQNGIVIKALLKEYETLIWKDYWIAKEDL